MSEKMKNLMVRTLSGAVLAVVVLGAVIWSQWSFGALLLAMLVAGMLEFYGLAEKQGNAPQKIVGMAAGIVLFALNFAFVSDDIEILSGASQAFACGMAFMLLLIPAMFICELYRKQQNPASGIGTTLMGVCYIALPLSLMCYIPIIGSEVWTPWVMIFYIFIIWANDVFAYLVGMSVGRHRMFERLSPKKSWEGFFGGLAGAVAMGYVAARVLDADVWAWLGLALVAAATGVLGDLGVHLIDLARFLIGDFKAVCGRLGVSRVNYTAGTLVLKLAPSAADPVRLYAALEKTDKRLFLSAAREPAILLRDPKKTVEQLLAQSIPILEKLEEALGEG